MENENATNPESTDAPIPDSADMQPAAESPMTEPPAAEEPAQAREVIPIEGINEATLQAFTVEHCEELLTYMHGMMNMLRVKAQLVHDVMEVKQREAEIAAKAAKMSPAEQDAMRAHLNKPPAQHLIGDHITRDNDQVNPGKGFPPVAPPLP